jgi:hypothetical protein
VALYIVVGDGEMSQKELAAQLTDLWDEAEHQGEGFWFILQAQAEPNETQQNLIAWLVKSDIYFEIFSDTETDNPVYEAAQRTHVAKKLPEKVVSLLRKSPEDDEKAAVLALFVNPKNDVTEDDATMLILEQVIDAEFPAFSLNGALTEARKLTEINLGGAEEEEEAEEPAPAAEVSKRPSRKVPANAKTYGREDLEDLTIDELRAIAKARGLDITSRSKAPIVDAILGENPEEPRKAAEAVREVEAEIEIPGGWTKQAKSVEAGEDGALLIIIFKGMVNVRAITPEQALELLQS